MLKRTFMIGFLLVVALAGCAKPTSTPSATETPPPVGYTGIIEITADPKLAPTPTPTLRPKEMRALALANTDEAMAKVQLPEGDVVARVNGISIPTESYVAQTRYKLYTLDYRIHPAWSAEENQVVPEMMAKSALDQLINREIFFQEIEKDGIVADEIEFAALRDQVIAETLAGADFQSLEQCEEITGMSGTLIEDSAKERAFSSALAKLQPPIGEIEQVHVLHILVADADLAYGLLAKIRAGEDFEAVAAESSQAIGGADNSADLGWIARGMVAPEFEDAAFALEPGQVSDVVTSTFGVHIIKVLANEIREPDPSIATKLETLALQQWFEGVRQKAVIERLVYAEGD